MNTIISILAFISTIVLLVGLHEFGHYYVAKKLGVKILKFSIGFGKILFSWQGKETTFCLSAIPLGGYVKMLDKREAEVEEKDLAREFTSQNVYKRFAIVFAGPAINLILAFVIYTAIYMIGSQGLKPIVGNVTKNSIVYYAGLQKDDEIVAINNQKTTTASNVLEQLLNNSFQKKTFLSLIDKDGIDRTIQINIPDDLLNNPKDTPLEKLGFDFLYPKLKPIIKSTLKSSPADIAGLKSGDVIIKTNNVKIDSWSQWVRIIKKNALKSLDIIIKRNDQLLNIKLTPNKEAKVGVYLFVEDGFMDKYYALEQKNIFESTTSAINKVYSQSLLTIKMIWRIVIGKASLEHLSGPIKIASYAGQSVQISLLSFLNFIAIISVSLGVLNLLPIFPLDGGHLLIYVIEIIKNSAVSESIQMFLQKIGISFITLLMLIALYNDVLYLL